MTKTDQNSYARWIIELTERADMAIKNNHGTIAVWAHRYIVIYASHLCKNIEQSDCDKWHKIAGYKWQVRQTTDGRIFEYIESDE